MRTNLPRLTRQFLRDNNVHYATVYSSLSKDKQTRRVKIYSIDQIGFHADKLVEFAKASGAKKWKFLALTERYAHLLQYGTGVTHSFAMYFDVD